MKEELLIIKNFNYFQNEILPYYFIVYTSLGEIVIDTRENNLKHLLGISKTENIFYKSMSGEKFYSLLLNNNVKLSLFDLINKDRFYEDNLYKEEEFIYLKNKYFITIFNTFISSTNLSFYIKKVGDDFDADYVHFCNIQKAGGYIGIIGNNKSDYHYFNSIMYEKDNPTKYIGAKIIVYKVEKILKTDFDFNKYKFVQSKRNINYKKQKHTKLKKIDYKKIEKKINKLLKNNLSIKVGVNGKNSIQIIKNKKIKEQNLKLDTSYDTPEKIAEYINKHY